MKLSQAMLCISCEEIVDRNEKACPSCTSEVLVPLSLYIQPILETVN